MSIRLHWYAAMLLAAVGLFYVIGLVGDRLEAPEAATHRHEIVHGGKPDALVHVLIALTAVVIVGRLLGVVFRYVGQPPVIGEVIGGIVLGPSVLGQVWPAAAEFVLPASVAPFLGVIAQLGVILYMFLVGWN